MRRLTWGLFASRCHTADYKKGSFLGNRERESR